MARREDFHSRVGVAIAAGDTRTVRIQRNVAIATDNFPAPVPLSDRPHCRRRSAACM